LVHAGRAEVTAGSDDDFMMLVDGAERDEVEPSIEAVKMVLDQAPGDQGVFGAPVFCDNLVENVGLDRDDNKNLTRRMLFILESVPATAGDVYAAARERVLGRYLDESIKDFRLPRFPAERHGSLLAHATSLARSRRAPRSGDCAMPSSARPARSSSLVGSSPPSGA
jgi:hypothetical protein